MFYFIAVHSGVKVVALLQPLATAAEDKHA